MCISLLTCCFLMVLCTVMFVCVYVCVYLWVSCLCRSKIDGIGWNIRGKLSHLVIGIREDMKTYIIAREDVQVEKGNCDLLKNQCMFGELTVSVNIANQKWNLL